MLYGELKFFHGDTVVKTVPDEEFSEFNPKKLHDIVQSIVTEIGADKCVSSCIFHGGASGTIDTILFPLEDDGA